MVNKSKIKHLWLDASPDGTSASYRYQRESNPGNAGEHSSPNHWDCFVHYTERTRWSVVPLHEVVWHTLQSLLTRKNDVNNALKLSTNTHPCTINTHPCTTNTHQCTTNIHPCTTNTHPCTTNRYPRTMNTYRCKQVTCLSRVSILTRDIDIANLSVRPSVCLLRSGIRWKRLNISSQFFHHTVAQSF